MYAHIPRLSQRWAGLALATGLLLQSMLAGNPAHAEGFVDAAFEAQWRTTDANRSGRTNQTYFWGPEAFAHTAEMYREGGTDGQRRVQYFDKARMELTNRAGQRHVVTNGLLTVELVSGRMQLGDDRFLDRSPATVVVAGDPLGNDRAPTYTSFNTGRLAFGVAGAMPAPQRAGQVVQEAVARDGKVSTITPPANVTYSRYFPQTGHNIASVFDTFFGQAPLSEATWLDVMGYPITEPFWAKDKVVVGGKERDVLVQLFQRRALTFTPANPAAYQIEMGNIGQHYYGWRYGTDERDRLPGNFRMINAIDNGLYSTSVRNPTDRVRLGSAPATITRVWTLSESRAIVEASGRAYLADLRSPRAFVALPEREGRIEEVVASPNGRFVAIRAKDEKSVVMMYALDTFPGDNIAVDDAYIAYTGDGNLMRFDASSRYLAIAVTGPTNFNGTVTFVDTTTRASTTALMKDQAPITRMEWIGTTDRVLVSTGGTDEVGGVSPKVAGSVLDIDAQTATQRTLLTEPYIRGVLPSPDGMQFAVLSIKGDSYIPGQSSSLVTGIVRVRSIAEPTRDLMPAYEQGTSGRYSFEPTLGAWSADGTYLSVRSAAGGTGGWSESNVTLVNSLTGVPLRRYTQPSYNNSFTDIALAAPFTVLERTSTYNGPDAQVEQTIKVTNVDGSDAVMLLSSKATPNTPTSNQAVETAQIVQVIVPE